MSDISNLNKQIVQSHINFYQSFDKNLTSKARQLNINYYGNLLPMFYREFNNVDDKILFVGINPSFNYKMHKGIDKKIFQYDFYIQQNEKQQKETINNLIEIQEGLKYGNKSLIKQISYFKCLESFSNNIGFCNHWVHYDIFPIRCTSQNLFKNVLNQKEFELYKSEFLKTFLKIVNENKFKAIFIFNLQSSIFIKDNIPELVLNQRFIGLKNEIYGHYHLNKTPVILFKQLTGGATTNIEKSNLISYLKSNLF